ncbi:DUF1624 domain-containing protein [Mariniflexile sp. AS56]|uniref:DUF1624 domain-containing protein n=1 Tax=Mariniflexile sp. AS56 TaxID=3063957 RepID=UPI0026E9E7AB|nr:heparan-alpha-glucosaminide N-acetyltransferase domain-containing protein [Mariniflexile sp. AS56]MDO7171490.1 heparan-alpha-glucosaminide N-acetyltransferase domain-containing protein [Mariniflexile sp. AS56]
MTKPTRIQSIDILKGLVMVLMALDHTRDYFHYDSFIFSPEDPTQSNLPIFFTRWITHFCAPAFSFLAGISAFIISKRKTKKELSGFLIKRGLWLVFIELTIVNFAWYFDVSFSSPGLFVIWVLGISMIALAGIIWLPRQYILLFSFLLIFGHNLLDSIHYDGSMLWAILHEYAYFDLGNGFDFETAYPLIPWVAVMSLGYYFGAFYNSTFDADRRKKMFNIIGIASLALFIILRFTNIYGNLSPWKNYSTLSQNLISFLNPAKYPPSLTYLLMTLGVTFIFLAHTEKLKGKVADFFKVFGRVPFFYYILHLYLIHGLALLYAELSGFGWETMILKDWVTETPALKGYGLNLDMLYLVWIGIILLLYPLCKKFDLYKQNNKNKSWLSYL